MPRHRRNALLAVSCLLPLWAAPLAAQSMADPVLPAGRLRIATSGIFDYATERYGLRTEGGSTVEELEPLGFDLTKPSAADFFPGAADLRERLAAALDDDASGFPLRLGASQALVTANRVEVPFSADVGVLDWLTVGVTVPLVKTRFEGTFEIAPDTLADLGVNPGVVNQALVRGFVESLADRAGAAATLASDACGTDPSSQACLDAQALAADLASAGDAFTALFGTSLLFPAAGTAAGDALTARVDALNTRLTDQGLTALEGLPLASEPLQGPTLDEFLTDLGGPFGYLAPPGTLQGPWELGDVEARVAVRLLAGEVRDSLNRIDRAWKVAALGTVRLPTGAARQVDAILLPRTSDGQLDLEGGLYAAFMSRHFAVRAQGLYTRQQPATVRDRVAPADVVLVPRVNIATLDWDPGDRMQLEIQPAFRLAPALSLGLTWHYLHQGSDRYTRLATPLPLMPAEPFVPSGAVYPDASVMDAETEQTFQEVGGSLTYQTTMTPGAAGQGVEVFIDVRTTVSGSGGRTPAGTRLVFGGRLLRRLWGR